MRFHIEYLCASNLNLRLTLSILFEIIGSHLNKTSWAEEIEMKLTLSAPLASFAKMDTGVSGMVA